MDPHLPSVQQEIKMNKFFVATLLAIVFAIALFEVNSLPLDDEVAPVGDEPHGKFGFFFNFFCFMFFFAI